MSSVDFSALGGAPLELGDWQPGQVFHGTQVAAPAIKIVRTVDWTMPTTAQTQLFLESTVFAQGGMSNGGGGGVPSFIQLPAVAGVYAVLGQIAYKPNATGERWAVLTSTALGSIGFTTALAGGGVLDDAIVQAAAIVRLPASDQLQLSGFQSSGGGLVIDHTATSFAAALLST